MPMSNTLSNTQIKDEIVKATEHLFRSGVMSHSGHANISARSEDNEMLLSIEGQVRNLTASGIARVTLEGVDVDHLLDPTNTEIVRMHSEIYKLRPNVGAIIHTHSPSLLAFALAAKELPIRYEALLRFGQASNVPVAPWAPRGSDESITSIINCVIENEQTNAVLLANHGVLVFSTTPWATAALLVALEEAAQGELAAIALGGAIPFPQGALKKVLESIARVH
jgi:L-fuculose-phosphate aldolase